MKTARMEIDGFQMRELGKIHKVGIAPRRAIGDVGGSDDSFDGREFDALVRELLFNIGVGRVDRRGTECKTAKEYGANETA